MMIGFSSISAVDESRAVSRFLPITITKLRCVGGTIVIQHVVSCLPIRSLDGFQWRRDNANTNILSWHRVRVKHEHYLVSIRQKHVAAGSELLHDRQLVVFYGRESP